jgi:RimJ/RimL family protein N-acetyltransferase
MKINKNHRILSEKVILVPYQKHHVLKYHDWMAIDEIQDLTCSEPLTLDEEYEMRLKWQEDTDKLTFIILSKDLFRNESGEQKDKEVKSMIGDVNVFIIDDEDGLEKEAEMEIMIVNHEFRGKGMGSEAVRLMIKYCLEHLTNELNLKRFVVKIDEQNVPSIKMFEKLGFSLCKHIQVFKQVVLKLEIDQVLVSNYTNYQLNLEEF